MGFADGVGRVKQAQLDGGGALRKNGEIDAIAVPTGPQRIRLSRPDAHANSLFAKPTRRMESGGNPPDWSPDAQFTAKKLV
jgi:hypothetical protein